jgi:hypothetical protein
MDAMMVSTWALMDTIVDVGCVVKSEGPAGVGGPGLMI